MPSTAPFAVEVLLRSVNTPTGTCTTPALRLPPYSPWLAAGHYHRRLQTHCPCPTASQKDRSWQCSSVPRPVESTPWYAFAPRSARASHQDNSRTRRAGMIVTHAYLHKNPRSRVAPRCTFNILPLPVRPARTRNLSCACVVFKQKPSSHARRCIRLILSPRGASPWTLTRTLADPSSRIRQETTCVRCPRAAGSNAPNSPFASDGGPHPPAPLTSVGSVFQWRSKRFDAGALLRQARKRRVSSKSLLAAAPSS